MAKAKNNKVMKMVCTAIIGVALVAIIALIIVFATQKNGLITENGDTYYYVNGEIQSGWQTINNERYYFDDDGKMHRGWLVWGDDAFYFRKGNGADDIGGTLLKNTKSVLQDRDGVYWYIEFTESGKINKDTMGVDVNKYEVELKQPVPQGVVPNFIDGYTFGK